MLLIWTLLLVLYALVALHSAQGLTFLWLWPLVYTQVETQLLGELPV